MNTRRNFHNIILRMPNWIGDFVMATAALKDIRKHFPDSRITAMCVNPLSELLEKDPHIDELYSFSPLSNQFFDRRIQKRQLIEKLKAGKYDLGILFTNSFSSAWWFWRAGIDVRLGFKTHFRSLFLNQTVSMPKDKNLHHVIKYKKLLQPLGIKPSSTSPQLFVEEEEIKKTKELLYQRGFQDNQKLIGMHPSAGYGPAKCWPKERFTQVIQKLSQNKLFFIVCFGDSGSEQEIKHICSGLSKNVSNLAGVTSLRELVCIIKICNVILTNDSGPMHIAAAVKTPLVALFGSTNELATGPYEFGKVICKKVQCSPCYLRKCPIDFRCMMQIEVEEVYRNLLSELENV